MAESELEAAVKRFQASITSLERTAQGVASSKPMTEQERSLAVARIDQAIGALQRVLGEEAADATS